MTIATPQIIGSYEADRTHSSFQFSVRHMNVSMFTASFDDVDVRVVGDEEGLSVVGSARAESVTIKSPREFRDHVVYGADFLDARNHPEITFTGDEVNLAADGTAALVGALTIKGVTKPFTATGTHQPVVIDPFGTERAGFEFTATIDRRDWGLDYQLMLPNGAEALANTVVLRAQVELVKGG